MHFQEKDVPDPSWVTLKLSIDSSFSASFGTTISNDYMLNFALAKKFTSSTELSGSDFDNLFVPFRATASEIFTEKAVVLKSGNLFEAARASMAVPFFYRPIKVNGELLFDGGIYNNFPVEAARTEFNPDIIIGVNVAAKKLSEYPHGKDQNLIAESVLFAILDKTDSTKLNQNDIFIDVELQDYHALNFKKADSIVQLGYYEAIAKMDELKRKIIRRTSLMELTQKRANYKITSKEIIFDSLGINGFNLHQKKNITRQFDPERPASFDLLEKGYNRIVADDYFANIIPSYSFKAKNVFTLSGNANPKIKGKIGGILTSRSISQLFVGVDFKRLKKSLAHYSFALYTGRFYQSLSLNSKVHFFGRLGVSLSPSIILNRWNFISTTDLFSKDKNPEIEDSRDNSYGVHLDLPVLQKMILDINGSYFQNKDKFSNDNELNSADTLDVMNNPGAEPRGIAARTNVAALNKL